MHFCEYILAKVTGRRGFPEQLADLPKVWGSMLLPALSTWGFCLATAGQKWESSVLITVGINNPMAMSGRSLGECGAFIF